MLAKQALGFQQALAVCLCGPTLILVAIHVHRLTLALAAVALANAPLAVAARHRSTRPVADPMTTAAIDITTKAVETRMSRVPADDQEFGFEQTQHVCAARKHVWRGC